MNKQQPTVCDCGHPPSPHGEPTTGYGTDLDGKTYCYDCCADRERQRMIETGKATLYYARRPDGWFVTDWPGHLNFKVMGSSKSRHNIGRVRVDFWFEGPDGFIWHGYQIGDWNQIAHCKRTKQKAVQA